MRSLRPARSTIFYGRSAYLGFLRAEQTPRQVYPIGPRGLLNPAPLQHNSFSTAGPAGISNNADRHKYSSAYRGSECED